jgi:8-oxo-dGTP diphosphatase
MGRLDKDIITHFGKKLRVRVNGIYINDGKILLIKHKSLGPSGFFWSPPGGGMEFGSSATDNLEREFFEETGLKIKVGDFLFVHEYLNVPLHAIELFFSVVKINGRLSMGMDPEMPHDRQIISEIKMMDIEEIKMLDKKNRHQVFEMCKNLNDLLMLKGYFKIET